MRILFLDDDKNRITKFVEFVKKKNREDLELDIAETATQAIGFLAMNPVYDYVFLDHDLLGMHFMPSDSEDSGAEVARYISGMAFSKRPVGVLVHSWNQNGAANMYMQLGVIPASVAAFATREFFSIVSGILER